MQRTNETPEEKEVIELPKKKKGFKKLNQKDPELIEQRRKEQEDVMKMYEKKDEEKKKLEEKKKIIQDKK